MTFIVAGCQRDSGRAGEQDVYRVVVAAVDGDEAEGRNGVI